MLHTWTKTEHRALQEDLRLDLTRLRDALNGAIEDLKTNARVNEGLLQHASALSTAIGKYNTMRTLLEILTAETKEC